MQNLSHKAGAYFAGFAFNGREYSLLPYLETFVNDIHFQQNGCRAIPMWWHGFKTRVLHFKLRYTVKRQKMYRGSSKNAQFSFCGGREAFHQKIVFRGIQTCFLHGGARGLFLNSTKAEKFLLYFQVHFAPCGHENFVFEK